MARFVWRPGAQPREAAQPRTAAPRVDEL